MKKLIIFALALLNTAIANSSPIKIGSEIIEIPEPRGFKRVENGTVVGLDIDKLRKLPSGAIRLLFFIPNDNKKINTLDEFLKIDKECNAAILEKMIDINVSQREFDEMKISIKKITENGEIEDIFESNRGRSSREMGNMMSDAYGAKIGARYGSVVPLEVTDVSDKILTTSVMTRAYYSLEDGTKTSIVKSTTTGFVYTNNKILQLSCTSSGVSSEWTRTAASDWARHVIQANNSKKKETKTKKRGNWTYKENYDKMRDERTHIAALSSSNTVSLKYPYDGKTSLTLEIRSSSKNEKIIVSTNKGMISCLIDCRALVKFDNGKIYKIDFEPFGHDFNAIILPASQNRWFFERLKSSSKIYIELPYYENGVRQFEFDSGNLIWNHYNFSD